MRAALRSAASQPTQSLIGWLDNTDRQLCGRKHYRRGPHQQKHADRADNPAVHLMAQVVDARLDWRVGPNAADEHQLAELGPEVGVDHRGPHSGDEEGRALGP
jgi:hypothetical protein